MKKNVKNEAQETNWAFRFYEIMGYPVPQPRAFFAWRIAENEGRIAENEGRIAENEGRIAENEGRIAENEGRIAENGMRITENYSENTLENGSEKAGKKFVLPDFSWSEAPSPLLSEFLAFLQKWSRLTRNFPFVQQIFLANSLSFNGLKPDSDLDLFVITKKGRIRTARLMMSLMMLFFGIKRTAKAERKRFCLSFFVDEEHIELEKLLLHEQDVYLPYWIAHLVPWYQEQRSEAVFQKNAWITRFLPHFQAKQMISLGLQMQIGRGFWKKFWELVLGGWLGTVVEKWIQKLWLPRIESLKKKNPEFHRGVIIEDGILKFHYDQRQKYSDLFFS